MKRRLRPMQQQAKLDASVKPAATSDVVVAFGKHAARSAERKSKSAIAANPVTTRKAFIGMLHEIDDQTFDAVRPLLDKVFQSHAAALFQAHKPYSSEAKIQARLDAALAGKRVDLTELESSERAAFFAAHYSGRTSFKEQAEKPAGRKHGKDFIIHWIKTQFPDRDKLNMMQADLKKLDATAWVRLQNWLRGNELPAGFGLPAKKNSGVRLAPVSEIQTGAEYFAKLRRGLPIRPEDERGYNRDRKRAARLAK